MRKLTMLGTGNAMVTKCYNTCFYVTLDDGALFLTDAGGGNGILRQLELTGFDYQKCHHMFVTHGLQDGSGGNFAGVQLTAFDILSTKAKQFGYELRFADGLRFTCLGDEPYNEHDEVYAKGADWLLAEAFCKYGDRDTFKPYEKNHSTVKEASELAEKLGVKNLVLYHTEDKSIATRKQAYTAEAKKYYHGNVFVPDDLDVIELG